MVARIDPRPKTAFAALPRRVHFLGICGRIVGSLAVALRKSGVRVSGSDSLQFPPIPETLRAAGIRVHASWEAAHVPRRVEAVVTGAVVQRGNPEFEECLDRGVPVWNTTAFLESYFLRGSAGNLVVAGTKGKTTTTAMLAWILREAGLDPDHLIGGRVRGGWDPLRLEGAALKVLEGDEYWCSQTDPVPKFLRYHPRHLVVTNVGFDHTDIYSTRDQYAAAFRQVVDLVPRGGSLTLNADDAGAMALRGRTPTPVRTVGFSPQADLRITGFRMAAWGSGFRVGGQEFRLPLLGKMNATNAALAAASAGGAGVSLRSAALALRGFPGVEGRQEILGRNGKSVLYQDDAYLPVAVKALLESVRQRHPRQRLVLFFMPRYTGGRDGWCQRDLPACLDPVDVAVVTSAIETLVPAKPFDHRRLCRELGERGVEAHPVLNITKMARLARKLCRPGDVVVLSVCLGADVFVNQIRQAVMEAVGPG